MRYLVAIALLLVSLTAAQSQNVPFVSIPGCAKAPTYDNGINLTVHVMTTKTMGDHDTENAIARDIARFKDTNHIKGGGDPRILEIEFEAHVTLAQVQLEEGNVYVSSFFITENCGVFNNGSRIPGFASHVLKLWGPTYASDRQKVVEAIEKDVYDMLIAEVSQRRRAFLAP